MTYFEFGLTGLGSGAVYSLIALAVVIVYRGSGVVNFAAGAQALLAAALYYELSGVVGKWPAAVITVLALGVVGALIHFLVMVPLRGSSPLMRVVATVALMEVAEQAAVLKYGTVPIPIAGLLPTPLVRIFGVAVTGDRLIILGIAVVLYVVLGAVYRRTRFGLATTGVAERELATAALGWSPTVVAAANWAIGGMLAGVAGILLGPITSLSPSDLTLVIVPALAGCLLGEFRSFPLVFAGTLGIGILTSEAIGHPTFTGAADTIPFVVIVAILLVRGRVLPLRSHFNDRLPSIGSGVITVPRVLLFVAVPAVALSLISASWAGAVTTAATYGLACVSVVIVVGFAGQLSLAQFAFVGLGALISSRLAAAAHVPFVPALLIAVIAVFPIGLLVALPAVRVRGVNLAIVTMGMGVVVSSAILGNPSFTGGVIVGTVVPPATLFGWNIYAPEHPQRYAWVCIAVLVLFLLLAGNIRRSLLGHRMIAVRNNERAAVSLGVSVVATKLYAFAVSASVAAAAGALIAFEVTSVSFDGYDVFASVNVVVLSVIGGVGHLAGAIVGGLIAPGSVTQNVLNIWFDIGGGVFLLVTAIIVVPVLIVNPNGAVPEIARMYRQVTGSIQLRLMPRSAVASRAAGEAPVGKRTRRWRRAAVPAAAARPEPVMQTPITVQRRTFEIKGLTVAYAGIVAVDNVSLRVEPGEVVGVIGPNGAGKTSLIDAATGFAQLRSGQVLLDGKDVVGLGPHKRARLGLCRAFQSLELFDDLTIRENLALASSGYRWSSYVTEPFHAHAPQLSAVGAGAVSAFELHEFLDRRPQELPYGQRRLASIARAVATGPSVLLLDEPASGLDERSAQEMATLIQQLAKESGMGVMVVEHNLDLVLTACDRVVVLEFGRVIATGTPAEVLEDPRVIAAYVGGTAELADAVVADDQSMAAEEG